MKNGAARCAFLEELRPTEFFPKRLDPAEYVSVLDPQEFFSQFQGPWNTRSTGSPYLESGFSSVSSMRSPGLCVKSRSAVVRSRSWLLFSAKRPPVVGIEAARAWDRQLSGFYEQCDGFADQRFDLGPVQDAVHRPPP
jgi:hypothetical protein